MTILMPAHGGNMNDAIGDDAVLGCAVSGHTFKAWLNGLEACYWFVPAARPLLDPVIQGLYSVCEWVKDDTVVFAINLSRRQKDVTPGADGSQSQKAESVNPSDWTI